jgi:predicted nucleic acid-binding protein
MAVLIDTNFVLALVFPRDANHQKARLAMRELRDIRIVPAPVLPELFYLATERMSYKDAMRVFQLLRSQAFRIEALMTEDMVQMQDIMEQYHDNEFDFVDTAIMSLAERLNIADIYTFDRRDFTVFRPRHRAYLRLLP